MVNKGSSLLVEESSAFLRIAEGSKFTHGQAREILSQAYKNLFHKDPTEGELDFGLGTAFFETGYGRAGGAGWANVGQFAHWASEGKYNWGALETSIQGEEGTLKKFKAAGLHPTKEKGVDAGRRTYFYLFPNDLEAATAFLMSWGRPDTLKAAASGSASRVAESMLNHKYYEGFHVAPGKMDKQMLAHNEEGNGKCKRNGTCFIQESSAEDARRKNIANYTSALNGHVAVVTGRSKMKMEPQQIATKLPSLGLEGFLDKFNNWFSNFISGFKSIANIEDQYLISITAEDLPTKTEYASVLQSVLKEELAIDSTIHTAGTQVELACKSLFGDHHQLLETVCDGVSDVFKLATKQIGGCQTETIITNAVSKLPQIDLKLSEINRRSFRLKIAKGLR